MSTNGGENSEVPILVDALIFEIFSRLPAKSIARFRCVSKQWTNNLRLPYFTDLFFTRSSSRPRLLFASHNDGHVFLLTSPQPQNIDENGSSLLAANHQMKIPYAFLSRRFTLVRDLAFLSDYQISKRNEHQVSMTCCNTSTRESMTLPYVKSWRSATERWSFFGYDPIEKQYKVLSMIGRRRDRLGVVPEEHQVRTLGNGEQPSWRRIECCISHSPHYAYNQICINGVVYYRAADRSSRDSLIVCFDVRSEKFRFVKDTDTFTTIFRCARLINYNGKLASIGSRIRRGITRRCTSIKLRVLEDAEKQEWSEHIYVLPALWKNIVGDASLRFAGVTRTNEIVLSSSLGSVPFYLFYYNTERNTITRVGIQGMESFMGECVYTYLDHVEDVKLL